MWLGPHWGRETGWLLAVPPQASQMKWESGKHTLRRPHRVVMKCKAPWSLAAWLPILALK